MFGHATPSSTIVEQRTRRTRRRAARSVAALAMVLAATTVTTTTAQAHGTPLACGPRSQSTVFARWNDNYQYFAMPNGGFESGTAEWRLTGGASVVAGNNILYAGGTTHTKSLRVPAGAPQHANRKTTVRYPAPPASTPPSRASTTPP